MAKERKKFSVSRLCSSFIYAFRGIRSLFHGEQNIVIHCIAAVCVIAAGIYFDISPAEWAVIAITIGCVFAAEAFNTAIERLSDVVSPERDERIKFIKDIAAGAVLIVAIAAAVVGWIVFYPKIIQKFIL